MTNVSHRALFARMISLIMCLLLTASLCACGGKRGPNSETPGTSSGTTAAPVSTQDILARSKAHAYFTADEIPENDDQKSTRDKFDVFLQKALLGYASEVGLVNVHYSMRRPEDYGLTGHDLSFGLLGASNSISLSARDTLDELRSYNYEDLSRKQRLTYDILDYSLRAQIEMEPFEYYSEPLNTAGGIHAMLPIYFAEYTFTRAQDVEDYLALMQAVPAFFDSVLSYEQKRIELGIFMSKDALDTVIEQARDNISGEPGDFYLNETFAEMLTDAGCFSETEIADYTTRHKAALENSFFPAYDRLISALDGMRSSCNDIGGAVNMPNGEAYIVALCKSYLATDKTLAQIKEALETSNTTLRVQLQTLSALDPGASMATLSFKQPTEDPAGIVAHLIDYYSDLFPSLGGRKYSIHDVPKGMEGSVSPAFYILPALDDYETHNNIYINNGSIANNGLFTTLAHEGYPGHMLQGTYFASTEPYPVRVLLTFLPYAEGWASYVERLSFEAIDGVTSTTAKMLAVNSRMSLNMLALVDLGLNYEGWTYKEYCDYMALHFGLSISKDAVRLQEFYLNMTTSPFSYLPYSFGLIELESILDEQKELAGDDFDLYQFHDAFLNIGPAPLHLVEKYMKKIF
ncbi:MAG: DUF885 domain-containing protein [Lachnospiraceae bacterium]|nr:DUF885 domain-containing protein [Lachnospiraceae bacterium]